MGHSEVLSRSIVERPVVIVISIMDALSSEVKDVLIVDREDSLEVTRLVSDSEFLLSFAGITVGEMVSLSLSNFGLDAFSGILRSDLDRSVNGDLSCGLLSLRGFSSRNDIEGEKLVVTIVTSLLSNDISSGVGYTFV